jgi:hypothetical protein
MNDLSHLLTPEEKLLLSICRLHFSEEQKSEIRGLMKDVKDWDRFVQLANNHGIIALTAYNIRENGLTDQVPDSAMKILDNGRMQSMIRNIWLLKRWKEVNTILTEAGIKHILLKGMALEYTVYGAKGLRQMTDNDILVKKDEAHKAWLLLQEYGFISDMIKSPFHEKIIAEIGKHLPTLRKDDYPVEIHHRLFYAYEKNEKLNDAIDHAVEIDLEGTRAYILNDDLHLDFLKEHLHYHLVSGDSQLRLFHDMELIKPGSAPPIPDKFLTNPNDSVKLKQRKNAYRIHFFSLPWRIRFRFLLGDIFPSLRWMKQRHKCETIKALFLYPRRIGKLFWLLKGAKALRHNGVKATVTERLRDIGMKG